LASAVAKAFGVIRQLRRSGTSLRLGDIARSVRIAPSTAHSILAELIEQGAVIQTPDKRYGLGPATFYLGAAYARSLPIYRGIWSELVQVAHELSLAAVIAVPWENHHLMVSVHQSGGRDLDIALGGRVPIEAGSFGKAYFAWCGAEIPANLRGFAPNSISDPQRYRNEVAEALARGYATDNEEFTIGVAAVSSGVTSEAGFEGVAALIGPTSHISDLGFDRAGRLLSGLASRASWALGDTKRIKVVGLE
jgi:IclR family acetate operon transcriptional repressor